MTTMENVEYLESAISNCADRIETKIDALHEKIKNNEKSAPAGGGKLYTAFEIIRLVQDTVSEAICRLDTESAQMVYDIERSIIAELVKEDNRETNI